MNTKPDLEPRRILVIDDNESIHDDFRKIFSSNAEQEGALSAAESALFGDTTSHSTRPVFQIDYATQGKEGLALVELACEKNSPYAVAFVDVRMPPGWDGIETTAKIWEKVPDLQIVICTAYSDYSWDEIAAQLPKSDQLLILKKPFDAVEVLQMGHALTEKWRLQQAVKFKLDFLQLNVDTRTRVLETENAKLKAEIERLNDALSKRSHGALNLQ